MIVSSRGHYGVRAMSELAKAFGRGPLSLTEIAEAENISLPYLEQIIMPLRRAGLVEGMRGAHGGYRLSRAPNTITVGEIFRAVEGPVAIVECASEDHVPGACEREPFCSSRDIWQRVLSSVINVLDSTTLADLAASAQPAPIMPRRLESVVSGTQPNVGRACGVVPHA